MAALTTARQLLELAHRRGQEVQLVVARVGLDLVEGGAAFEHLDQFEVLGDGIRTPLRHAPPEQSPSLEHSAGTQEPLSHWHPNAPAHSVRAYWPRVAALQSDFCRQEG